MSRYKLSYFNIRGTAEVSRQILACARQTFEDHRISRKEWQTLKKETPFHRLPVLYVDGKPLGQSHSIARYLAREFHLNGVNDWEEAQANSLADQFKDYQLEVHPYFMAKNGIHPGDTNTLYHEVFLPSFEKNYQFFTNFLKSSGSGFLVGNSLTWVDLLIAQNSALIEFNGLENFPELKDHQKRIHEIVEVKHWIQTRTVLSRN